MSDPVESVFKVFRSELLALAFLGAIIALSFWPAETIRKAAIKIGVGTTIAGASAPAVYSVVLWKWPDFPVEVAILGALYFWLGLLGMQIVPVVTAVLNRLRTTRMPGAEE